LWRNGERVELDGTQYSHDWIAEAALEFVSEHRERPFLLYVPFTIPHLALQVPEDSLAEYRGRWEDPPYEGGKGYRPHPTPRAAYAAMVTRMDRDVGRIVARLRELGLEDDTLVLFTSDNGPTYDRLGGSDSEFFESTGGLRGFKGSVYEGGLRVPLVARWPGVVPAGAESAQLAAFWDLLPTLAELCGAQAPADCDGESFASVLRDGGERARSVPLYWELAGYGGQQALRDGDWKAVRRNLKQGKTRTELYDLARDPAERRELAIEHPDVVARMDSLFASSRTEHPAFPLSKRN
jgi:arylsulfatase